MMKLHDLINNNNINNLCCYYIYINNINTNYNTNNNIIMITCIRLTLAGENAIAHPRITNTTRNLNIFYIYLMKYFLYY